jgi:alpha-tubulin suppressor-like RCC1 family protein
VAVKAVAAGEAHSIALDTNGDIWVWGNGDWGQTANCPNPSPVPCKINKPTGVGKFTGITAGLYHNLAIDDTGRVWGWGKNLFNELGTGKAHSSTKSLSNDHENDDEKDGKDEDKKRSSSSELTLVKFPAGFKVPIVQVAAGQHSLALDANGNVWAWGANWAGQLGDGTDKERSTPVMLPNFKAKAIVAGTYHSLAIGTDANSSVYTWGENSEGQLGLGNTENRNRPTRISDSQLKDAIQIAGGFKHSMVLTKTGQVYTFGQNNLGQLGIGNSRGKLVPTLVSSVSGVIAISAGDNHCLIVS